MIKPEDELAYVVRRMPDRASTPCSIFAFEVVRLWRYSECVFFWMLFQTRFSTRPNAASPLMDISTLKLGFASLQKVLGHLNASPTPPFELTENDPKTFEEQVILSHDNIEILAETLVARIADAFLTYLVELLMTIYIRRPEMLKSNREVSYEFVLSHPSLEELHQAMSERFLYAISHKSFKVFVESVEKQGLELFVDKTTLEDVDTVIEVRNLITHNRGVVNRLFKSRQPNFKAEIGEQLDIYSSMHGYVETLTDAAFKIDGYLVDKFGLDTVPLRSKISAEQNEVDQTE